MHGIANTARQTESLERIEFEPVNTNNPPQNGGVGFRMLQGSMTFTNHVDAQTVFDDMESLINDNTLNFEYVKLVISNNTHHWSSPQPDVSIDSLFIGTTDDLNQFNRDRDGER